MPLPLLKPMGQSRRGVSHLMEAQRPPLILRILQVQIKLPEGAEPPRLESPHAVIDPSALMTAKADAVE
jgi:hypothetical protein